MEGGWLVCVPAYGRQLNTIKEIEEHWNADKDFRIVSIYNGGGTYVNRRDAIEHELVVEVRYGKQLEKMHILNSQTKGE